MFFVMCWEDSANPYNAIDLQEKRQNTMLLKYLSIIISLIMFASGIKRGKVNIKLRRKISTDKNYKINILIKCIYK